MRSTRGVTRGRSAGHAALLLVLVAGSLGVSVAHGGELLTQVQLIGDLTDSRAVTLSPDGAHAYVATVDAVVVLERDASTGTLTFVRTGPIAAPTGLVYRRTLSAPDGLTSLRTKSAPTGQAKVIVAGRGERLTMPSLPLVPPVTVQINQAAVGAQAGKFDARK